VAVRKPPSGIVDGVWLSLAAAMVAALCYGVACVMQSMAARAASRRKAGPAGSSALGRVDPSLVLRMLHHWRFIASLGLDLVGFVAQLIALRRLPLFAVQAIVAANLAVTAVVAAWLIHLELSVREWLAVAGVVLGVGMLGSSAGQHVVTGVSAEFKLALILAVAGIAVIGVASSRLRAPLRTPMLGAVAGLGYGVLAVAARVLPGFAPQQLVRDPAAYALAAAGVVSFMLYATALEDGSVTVATAACVLAETVPPAAVGILFLGDHTRPGLGGVAVLGFSFAVVCAVALARFGETDEEGLTAAQRRVRQSAESEPRPHGAS
jgi:drug/metabolite transporter (DMT)-like permease